MSVTARGYKDDGDWKRISDFLIRTYSTGGGHVNWTQPRWEYMHFHPNILERRFDLGEIGVWETQQGIVGVVHPEHDPGTVYVEIDPEYESLKSEMLEYAEEHLSTESGGVHRLSVYISDDDGDFQESASEMGYVKGEVSDPMSQLPIPSPFPVVSLPSGFKLKSLAEDNDLGKLARVSWRGFNHGDGPPDDAHLNQGFMQTAPNYRKGLFVVVEAPDGEFVSYCGMWFDSVNSIGYVEPVATDPDYRRMGLGRAAVLDSIRRCGEIGATVAWVGATVPFYLSLGFQPTYNSTIWQREWI
jgi:GNAT superfamily N-acetyltransferase